MNERIKELAEQATVWKDANHGYTFDKEKFAELIVRECLDIGANHKAYALMGEIMEHFGVEE